MGGLSNTNCPRWSDLCECGNIGNSVGRCTKGVGPVGEGAATGSQGLRVLVVHTGRRQSDEV